MYNDLYLLVFLISKLNINRESGWIICFINTSYVYIINQVEAENK